MGGTVELEIKHGYPVLKNHERLTGKGRSMAISLLGKDHVEDMDIRMTAEDFAWFTRDIPGFLYRLGVKEKGTKNTFPLHSPMFRANEAALRTGVSLMAYLAIKLLKIEAVEKINS
jgi:metal-dependent amidase/aminoacylase/carboxypeptidase family protein